MSVSCPPIPVSNIGNILNDVELPLKDRFRALFTLRNIGGHESIDLISKSFNDKSALLKHELAYCLGQMQNDYAVPILLGVLADKTQEPMVRHEAGEALGAIGCPDVLDQLAAYTQDDTVEVAETCVLAMARIKWLQNSERDREVISENPYKSVDPAPASGDVDIPRLRATLMDESLPLFERYRAIFSLRNIGTAESVIALAEGLKCRSALFRHEIAYVLGQIQHAACVARLTENLRDVTENPMVRHECAEALGSIATTECMATLDEYLHDTEQVVRDSCIVALDMCEYEQSGEFQYADTMARLKEGENLLPHAF